MAPANNWTYKDTHVVRDAESNPTTICLAVLQEMGKRKRKSSMATSVPLKPNSGEGKKVQDQEQRIGDESSVLLLFYRNVAISPSLH